MMASKNPMVIARSRVKAALKNLTPEQRVHVLADTLTAVGLPSFSAMLLESLGQTKAEVFKEF